MEFDLTNLTLDEKVIELDCDEKIVINAPQIFYAHGTFTPMTDISTRSYPIAHGLGQIPKIYWISPTNEIPLSDRAYAGQFYNSCLTGINNTKQTLSPVYKLNAYSYQTAQDTLFSGAAPDINYIYATPVDTSYKLKMGLTYSWGAIYWND